MSKICTDIEQSDKLIELGIDANTADMYYMWTGSDWMPCLMEDGDYNSLGYIPAWSLSALLELMPYPFLSELSNGIWKCGSYPKGICNYITSESSLDAAFEMVCWLKENKKI